MNHVNFDILTRRASLLTLGTAGLAALVHPVTAGAKKRNKKRKKGDANKLCKKQEGQCLDFFIPLCEDDNPLCGPNIEQCCQLIGTCDFNGFILCSEL